MAEMTRETHGKDAAGLDAMQAQMEVLVGYILTVGVVLSILLVAGGLIWRWLATGQLQINYPIQNLNLFQFVLADVSQIFHSALRPRLLVSLGIAVLMLTPYLRVLFSVFYFALVERNAKYTVFTGFVLSVLTYSLFLR